VCFGIRGVDLCKSCDVEIVQNASGVLNTAGKDNGDVGGKNGYIYLSFCDFLVQLVLLVNKHKMAQPSSYTTTSHMMNGSLEMRFNTCGQER